MFHLGRDLTEIEKGALLDLEMKPNMGNTTSADRFILRKEELKDMVTAKGKPSGIATTIIVIDIIIASNISNQSLLFSVKLKFKISQFGSV